MNLTVKLLTELGEMLFNLGFRVRHVDGLFWSLKTESSRQRGDE
jgi:hypothetical protein